VKRLLPLEHFPWLSIDTITHNIGPTVHYQAADLFTDWTVVTQVTMYG